MRKTDADEALLSLLREDARASTAELARKLGLSRTTVQNRIARLEAEGVIRGYTVRLDDERERLRIRAHIMLTVRPKQMPAVVRVLQAMPEVRVLYSISGGHDLIALAATATVGALLARGFVASDSPYGPLRFAVPRHALRFYFPALWPEAEQDEGFLSGAVGVPAVRVRRRG